MMLRRKQEWGESVSGKYPKLSETLSSSPLGFDRHVQAPSLSIEERKWEDLNMDCLANIFGRVGICSLLLDVPFVCKSWSKATLSPPCWQRLVFPQCYDFFTHRLMEEYQVHGVFSVTSFMKSVINRSKSSATMVALPSWCTKEALVYVAEECPSLRNLELPLINLKLPYNLHKDLMLKIPNLISKWKNLEHLRLESGFKFRIIAQISIHCKNFHSLTVRRASIGKDEATAIVTLLPNIRYLDLSNGDIGKEELLKVLQGCKELVHLDVSKCFTFKVDDEILKLGSRISTFKYCQRMKFIDRNFKISGGFRMIS